MQTSIPLRRLLWWLLVILLLFMPYSTFLLQALRHSFHIENTFFIRLTVGWKEVLLGLMLLVTGLIAVFERRLPFKLLPLDRLLLVCIGLGVGFGWRGHLGALAFGFRYDFSPFLYYFCARTAVASKADFLKLLRILLWTSLPIAIFAILQVFVLPQNFLERFGYSWGGSVTGNPLPPYHLVANSIVRAMATFPGPNSLALYASILFFLAVTTWRKAWPFSALLVLTLVLSFSRAHLGALVLALGLVWLFWRAQTFKVFLAGAALALTVSVVATFWPGNLSGGHSGVTAFVLHDDSSAIHRDLELQAVQGLLAHPLGHGLGTAGLATTNTGGTVFNPESWYLQLAWEYGWLGLLFGLSVVYMVLKTLWELKKEPTPLLSFLVGGFAAVFLSSAFLPMWFEVGSLIWWILFGIVKGGTVEVSPVGR